MISFDDVTKENIKKHNSNWLQIPNHPYRISIIGEYGSGKTNSLFNIISQQPDIDQINLYAEYPYEAKYQFLINKQKRIGLKYFDDSKPIIEYWNNMDNICKNIEKNNSNKKRKKLIVFDDMIADMLSNKNLNSI